jgi:hypothetical protein
VQNIPGHRDHRSGVPHQLITISPEWVITIVWNPDHDQPGIGDHDRPESLITIVRNPHQRPCAGIMPSPTSESRTPMEGKLNRTA